MSKGYLIATIVVTDENKYKKYIKAATDAINGANCKVLVRGGRVAVKEGETNWNRVVVLEFQTYEDAIEYYDSKEYQSAKKIRDGAAIADFVIAGD